MRLEEENRYLIIEGHRRSICVGKLGDKTVWCRVYPKMGKGELESLRFELQNNRRSWRPLERSSSLQRIKSEMRFQTNKQMAEHLGMNESLIINSLQLSTIKMDYLEVMSNYQLPSSYHTEFVRLKPKIRKIREFEAHDIILKIFSKVQHKVITNAHDFRKLGRVFLRATANEEELYKFISDPDMTISELEQRTIQSGFSLHIEQVIQRVSSKRQEGVAFSSQERTFLEQLKQLLNDCL